jgi:hypothetical protein
MIWVLEQAIRNIIKIIRPFELNDNMGY